MKVLIWEKSKNQKRNLNSAPYINRIVLFETDFHLFTKQVSLWPAIVVGALFLLLGLPLLSMIFGETGGSTSG